MAQSTEDQLREQIEQLEARLKKEELENAVLHRLLFSQYARQPRVLSPLKLPISDRAILLFEVLPQTFSLEEVLAFAEKLNLTEVEASEHVRTYFQEGMLMEAEQERAFTKTGHRPYL